MALKTKVKVGNITNLSDARYCAGMGVDMLGFRIGEAKGHVSPVKFKEITDWISGPDFILELSEEPVSEELEKYNVGQIELSVSTISTLDALPSDWRAIVRADVSDWKSYETDLLKYVDKIQYVLITNSHNIDERNAKSAILKMAEKFDMLLGFEIERHRVDEYLSWSIAGFALNGSEETSPGIKDYDHLSSILEQLDLD